MYGLILFGMMIVAPLARITQRVIKSNTAYVPIALAYVYLLAISWQPDSLSLILPGSLQAGLVGGFSPQFFPTLDSIATLFSRPATAASFLVHLLYINLFMARTLYMDGQGRRITTRHTVLLTMLLGPIGFLSHEITKLAYSLASQILGRDVRTRPKPVTQASQDGKGSITLYPYLD